MRTGYKYVEIDVNAHERQLATDKAEVLDLIVKYELRVNPMWPLNAKGKRCGVRWFVEKPMLTHSTKKDLGAAVKDCVSWVKKLTADNMEGIE